MALLKIIYFIYHMMMPYSYRSALPEFKCLDIPMPADYYADDVHDSNVSQSAMC